MAEMIWNAAVSVYNFIMDNIVLINIFLALVIVFFQRRSPQTVWTWLLLLYFIPILGFVMYLIIGQDFHKSRMFKAKEIEGELKYAVRRQEETIYYKRLRMANPEMSRLYGRKREVPCAYRRDEAGEEIYPHAVLHYPQR